MLRIAYIHFMQELQKELRDKVGVPFQVKIDVTIGMPPEGDKEKLQKFVEETLKPIMKEIPSEVVMS